MKKLKIGFQKQAKKSIYLLPNGKIECGDFVYNGIKKKENKEVYNKILEMLKGEEIDGVSEYKYWDAINIYDEFIVNKWNESISASELELLAKETIIFKYLIPIRILFKESVSKKWKKIFKNSDPEDPNTPKQGWQIL